MIEDQMPLVSIDLASGWSVRPAREGVSQKILAGEELRPGSTSRRCTRLVKFEPKAISPARLAHSYTEESFLLQGDLRVIDEQGREIACYEAPAYVSRPPGSVHGPFRSEKGCLILHIEHS